jgi:hypothetical protein
LNRFFRKTYQNKKEYGGIICLFRLFFDVLALLFAILAVLLDNRFSRLFSTRSRGTASAFFLFPFIRIFWAPSS